MLNATEFVTCWSRHIWASNSRFMSMKAGELSLLAAAVIAAASISGCTTTDEVESTPTITLEEAKKISAEFSKVDLQPPPRSAQPLIETFDPSRDLYSACLSTTVIKTIEELKHDVSGGFGNPRFANYARRADEFFLQGDTKLAIDASRLAIASYGYNPYNWGIRSDSEIHALLAVVHATTGNIAAANEALNGATSLFRSTRASFSNVWILRARGAISSARGELILAEAHYREAIEQLKSANLTRTRFAEPFSLRHTLQAELAAILARQGRTLEAENVIRDALRFRSDRSIKFSRETAYILIRYSEVLYQQGRFEEAILAARMSIAVYEKICAPTSSLFIAEAHALVGESYFVAKEWQKSIEQFDAVSALLADSQELFSKKFENNVSWATALLITGDSSAAAAKLENAVAQLESLFGPDIYEVIEAKVLYALAKIGKRGNTRLQASDRQLVGKLLALSRAGVGDGAQFIGRDRRLSIVLSLLIENEVGSSNEGAAQKAFEYAQYAHRGRVRHAYAASLARSFSRDPEFASLIRQEQDASLQLTALRVSLSNLYELAESAHRSTSIRQINEQIAQLKLVQQPIRRKILEEHPAYFKSANPRPETIEGVHRTLGRDEALILTYLGEDQVYVWAISNRGDTAFARTKIGSSEISDLVALVRQALEPNVTTLGEIPAVDLSAAYRLFEVLLKPVSNGWWRAKNLLVVADGPLGYLPMALLPTRPPKPLTAEGLLFA